MHNLPHRAQIMTTFSNEIPLNIRQETVLHFRITHASFFAFIISKKISATYAFHMCVGYDKTKQTPSNKICYNIYIRQILYKNTCICVPIYASIYFLLKDCFE